MWTHRDKAKIVFMRKEGSRNLHMAFAEVGEKVGYKVNINPAYCHGLTANDLLIVTKKKIIRDNDYRSDGCAIVLLIADKITKKNWLNDGIKKV